MKTIRWAVILLGAFLVGCTTWFTGCAALDQNNHEEQQTGEAMRQMMVD